MTDFIVPQNKEKVKIEYKNSVKNHFFAFGAMCG